MAAAAAKVAIQRASGTARREGRGLDWGNGGSGGLLKRVAQPIPDPLQVVLFAGGLGRAVQPAGSALREDQLL